MAENNAMNVRIVDGDDCCPQAMCVKVCNLVQEVRKTGASKKLIPSEKAVSDALKGRQELLVAGAAEGILGPSAATGLAQVLTAPSAGVSIVDAIKGRTLKWNQLLNLSPTTITQDGVTVTINSDQSISLRTDVGGATADTTVVLKYSMLSGVPQGDKIFIRGADGGSSSTYYLTDTYSGAFNTVVGPRIFTAPSGNCHLGLFVKSGFTATTPIKLFIYVSDLTAMFRGGNEPSTGFNFAALYPNLYYAINAGTLLPFKGTGLKVTGFNQWDEQWESGTIDPTTGQNADAPLSIRSKNYIPVIGGATYYNNGYTLAVVCYDANKHFVRSLGSVSVGVFAIPAGVAFIRFRRSATSYANDICINISDPSINGTYKPYTETLVNIDAIGKSAKDSDGNPIVPFPMGVNGDGTNNDEYGREGGTLRWGVRAYEAGDESDATVITDGTNTVYQLDADVPFTWDEPLTLAFTAEEGGTIWLQPEGVDEAGVPATAPLNADIAYTVPAGQVITATTLVNLLDQFKAAGVISAYTMTPDGTGNFTFTITA